MMGATDDLRRMLDLRGVEWSDRSDESVLHTTWNDMRCWFNEFADGWTAWGMAMQGTPEDAIEATLGRGTCRDVAIEGEWFECSECGTVKQLIHPNYCPHCGRRVVEVDDEGQAQEGL